MKTFNVISPIRLIEALCHMGCTEGCGRFKMPYSKDNSEQDAMLKHMFLPNDGISTMTVYYNPVSIVETDPSYPEVGMIMPPGYYFYSYDEELPINVEAIHRAYSMKIELCIDEGEGFKPTFSDVYLYYMGGANNED